jgi:biopolymer transport protein ExbD
MKPFIHRKKVSTAMDMAPLIDVMFMLLLFFLLTSSFLKPGIPLEMPKADNTKLLEEEGIIISVERGGNIFVNRRQVALNELENLLEQELAQSDTKIITFRGDESILYERFVSVLNIVKRSGAKELNIAHEFEARD